jgi:hypothetical protein
VSECVAPRLVLPGVVVTWFVTGFPDLGKADGSCPVSTRPADSQSFRRLVGIGHKTAEARLMAR